MYALCGCVSVCVCVCAYAFVVVCAYTCVFMTMSALAGGIKNDQISDTCARSVHCVCVWECMHLCGVCVCVCVCVCNNLECGVQSRRPDTL